MIFGYLFNLYPILLRNNAYSKYWVWTLSGIYVWELFAANAKTEVNKVVIAMACDLVVVKCGHYPDVIIPSDIYH
jgi:hypothetical protein